MKEYVGTAMNALYAPTEDGGVRAMAEVIILYSEPSYRVGADGLERDRQIGDIRVAMSLRAMRETARHLLGWADAEEENERRINAAIEAETAPVT